jgi:hypothetical protein
MDGTRAGYVSNANQMLCRYSNRLGTLLYSVVLITVDSFQWTDPPSQNFYLFIYLPIFLSLDLGRFFTFLILYTVGRTPWTRDQPVARPLPTYRTTQTQNKRIPTSDIPALSGIRTNYPSVRVSEGKFMP